MRQPKPNSGMTLPSQGYGVEQFVTPGDLDAPLDFAKGRSGLGRRPGQRSASDQLAPLASLVVDMRVTQLVDGNKGIHAMLPKRYAPA